MSHFSKKKVRPTDRFVVRRSVRHANLTLVITLPFLNVVAGFEKKIESSLVKLKNTLCPVTSDNSK